MQSKHPMGTMEDNPNIILAKEKAWTDAFEQTGVGYFKLLKERMKLLGAPTELIGEPQEFTVGNSKFYQFDAINTKIAAVKQKQLYICTFRDGYYVYFVLSYNDKTDSDFEYMLQIVNSFN